MPSNGDEYCMSGSLEVTPILVPDTLCMEVPFTKMNKAGETACLEEKISGLGFDIRCEMSHSCLAADAVQAVEYTGLKLGRREVGNQS